MNYNWNWSIFWQPAPDGSSAYLWWLVSGLGWTLSTALLAWAIALTLGATVGTLRTTPLKWVVRLGNAYVELFRNVPLLVQMFLWYFVLPELLPMALGEAMKQMAPPWGSFWPAVLCLGFYTSARIAEQTRAGIQSLPGGQRMAATALGLTLPQAYRHVLLPQTFRIMLRKDDAAFKKVVNGAINALYKSGEINKIYEKWFQKPIPPKGVNLNVPMSAQFKKVVGKPTDSGDPKDYK